MSDRVLLDGSRLTPAAVAAVARDGARVELAPQARARVEAGYRRLCAHLAKGTPIYGLTTGFGALDGRGVGPEHRRRLQENLLRSHAAGVGDAMPAEEVRAMMVIRANVLAGGHTGVRPEVLDTLLALLNADIVPEVPERGSVGACGDLAPLAHMSLPFIGEGWVRYRGARLPAAEALRRAGIVSPGVEARDGLALINGTEQTTAIGCLALVDARTLVLAAEAAAAMSLEALGALTDSFDRRLAATKPHPGQLATARRLEQLTRDSRAMRRPGPGRLRDALSLRCVPQVIGATRDALDDAERALTIEINAANDNPLIDPDDDWLSSNSGNFHGQRVGEVLDHLATSLASVAVMSERRSARLVDPMLNGGLPPFLVHPEAPAGVNSGFMIAQYTAASLVAELRCRAVAASIQSVPTCANTEDHVPMAPIAARHARWVVDTAARVVAIEFLLAAQALDLRGLEPGRGVALCHRRIRAHIPVMVADRVLSEDIARASQLVLAGELSGEEEGR